jgi:glutathione S-transferase
MLDDILADRVWLVGPADADFRVATALPFAEQARLPADGFSNIRRWHDRLMEIDAWRVPFEGLD